MEGLESKDKENGNLLRAAYTKMKRLPRATSQNGEKKPNPTHKRQLRASSEDSVFGADLDVISIYDIQQ